MTERPCPVCGTNHNDLCTRIADAVHAKRAGDFLWTTRAPAKALTTLDICIHEGCGKRAHWGTCKDPRPRYFPSDLGYGISEVERAARVAAKLPMFASEAIPVDTKPVHKVSTPVHKPASVDSEAVHTTGEGDTAAKRAAYKREWMAKKRAEAAKP